MIESNKTFKKTIQAITYFDNLVAGNYRGVRDFIQKADVINEGKPKHEIIKELVSIVDHLLNGEERNKYDPYIYETFKLYLDIRSELHIDFFQMGNMGVNYSLRRLLLDDGNIPRLELFKNLETVSIQNAGRRESWDSGGYNEASLLSLLSRLEKSTIEEITITAHRGFNIEEDLYLDDLKLPRQEYKSKGYLIKSAGNSAILIDRM